MKNAVVEKSILILQSMWCEVVEVRGGSNHTVHSLSYSEQHKMVE